MIGKTIGHFRIVKQIGSGGMGAVFLAEHQTIGNQVAIKMLRPELGYRKELVKRFFNEARAITRVKHPSIVAIHDFGVNGSRDMYIVMEYLRGETLGEYLRREGTIPWQRAVALARQVASALDMAHKQKIVHRDLKPDNLFLVQDPAVPSGERVKLLDFGVAKFLEAGSHSAHTMTGQILGTPAYMAPEQCASELDLDGRVDLYALGCILFHMVCGQAPFGQANASGAAGVLVAQIHDPPPRPREFAPRLPGKLEALILRLLEKQRDNRYPNARALIHDLDGLLGVRGDPSLVTSTMDTGEHSLGPPSSSSTPAMPATPSTLDAAAAASYNSYDSDSFPGLGPRKSSRTPWVFALGMLFAGCAVAGFLYHGQIMALLGLSPGKQAVSMAAPESDPSDVDAPAPGPEPAADDVPGAPSDAEATAPDNTPGNTPGKTSGDTPGDTVEVTIDSRPTGAQIFASDSDEALGVTPHTATLTRDADDARTFIIRAHGYEDYPVEVSGGDPADVTAELVELEGRLSAAEKRAAKKRSGKKRSSKRRSGKRRSGKKKSGSNRTLNPFD